MLQWTWWLLTLALQGRLYRALQPKLYATRNLCMHDFVKLHHNWDAYMGVQKRKNTFNCIWTTGKRGSQLVCCTILISQLSLKSSSTESSVSNKIPRYLYWSTDFTYWPPNFNTGVAVPFALSLKRHTNSFVAVDNNPMRFFIRLARISYSLQSVTGVRRGSSPPWKMWTWIKPVGHPSQKPLRPPGVPSWLGPGKNLHRKPKLKAILSNVWRMAGTSRI